MAIVNGRYLVVRTIQTVVTLFLIMTFLFLLFRIMPGDFSSIMLFQGADERSVAAFRQRWALDQPIYVQYWRYLVNLAQGDVGMSLRARTPVFEYLRVNMFNSFIVIAPAITTAYILGSLYGILAGINRGSILERHGIVPILFVGAFPSFFIAIVLVVVFSSWLGFFPTSGMVSTETRLLYDDAAWWRLYLTSDFLLHYSLPFTAVLLRYLFLPSLIMRTSMVEVQGQSFIYYQRITGLPKVERIVNMAKNASLPVITLYPVSMGRAIGGMVLIEVVFNWPGVGYALVQAVFYRDFPVMMFVFFVIALFIVISNYVIDVVYGIIDPRVEVGT